MKKSKKPYYGKRTKQKVVNEYEFTSASMKELAELHGIFGSNTVANWIKKYGKLELKQPLSSMKKPATTLPQKENRKQRQRRYEQYRISELEAELNETRLRVKLYTCALAVASEMTGIDLLKKIGEQLSRAPTSKES